VRKIRIAWIEGVLAFGDVEASGRRGSNRDMKSILVGNLLAEPIDNPAAMPAQASERLAEAVRRGLPEMIKLDGYERRAAARRDRAIKEIIRINSVRRAARNTAQLDSFLLFWQNEANFLVLYQ
jgi:hypothetical protein